MFSLSFFLFYSYYILLSVWTFFFTLTTFTFTVTQQESIKGSSPQRPHCQTDSFPFTLPSKLALGWVFKSPYYILWFFTIVSMQCLNGSIMNALFICPIKLFYLTPVLGSNQSLMSSYLLNSNKNTILVESQDHFCWKIFIFVSLVNSAYFINDVKFVTTCQLLSSYNRKGMKGRFLILLVSKSSCWHLVTREIAFVYALCHKWWHSTLWGGKGCFLFVWKSSYFWVGATNDREVLCFLIIIFDKSIFNHKKKTIFYWKEKISKPWHQMHYHICFTDFWNHTPWNILNGIWKLSWNVEYFD